MILRGLPLLVLAGCSGFAEPRAADLEALESVPPPPGPFVRIRATVDLDGRWLAGTFEAVVVARSGPDPAVRLQLFPDLGGKALDLAVRRDRITGFFPATGEGIDWALPSEARAHPLLFMGLTLLERFHPVAPGRAVGVRPGPPPEILLRPAVEGVRVVWDGGRRFRWGPGIEWRETGTPFERVAIEAKDLRIAVRVHECRSVERMDPAVFTLVLPDGVRRS
jgi:hypothetical protein